MKSILKVFFAVTFFGTLAQASQVVGSWEGKLVHLRYDNSLDVCPGPNRTEFSIVGNILMIKYEDVTECDDTLIIGRLTATLEIRGSELWSDFNKIGEISDTRIKFDHYKMSNCDDYSLEFNVTGNSGQYNHTNTWKTGATESFSGILLKAGN